MIVLWAGLLAALIICNIVVLYCVFENLNAFLMWADENVSNALEFVVVIVVTILFLGAYAAVLLFTFVVLTASYPY